MAKMIPRLEKLSVSASPEHRVFENIRTSLSDNWTVLHSLNVGDTAERPLGDIDLILAGPNAVHGISIARSGASWLPWYSKGWLKENPDPLSVATPVRALRNSLMTMLRENVPELFDKYEPVVGIGFALWADHPEARDNSGSLVLDIDSNSQEIVKYFDELTQFWAIAPAQLAEIDEHLRDAVVKLLRPVLDRRMALVEDATRIEQARVELTREQYELFDAFDITQNPRLLVEGGAGTGKTLCAIDLAKMEAASGKRVLLSCFNRKLEDYFRKKVDSDLGIKIMRVHDLCRELVEKAGMSPLLSGRPEDNKLYREVYPAAAREAIKALGADDSYDTIVMDEGQDIINNRYLDLYDDLLTGGIREGTWAIFYDLHQDIFRGTEDKALERLRNTRPFIHELKVNCRNTLDIADIAGCVSGIDPIKNKAVKGLAPDLLWYQEDEEQCDQISRTIAEWLDNGIGLDQIVVLSRRKLENSALRDGLNHNILNLPLVDWDSESVERPTGVVVFSTIHNFKGLESEFVLLADVDSLEEEWQRRLYYVGITRANTVLTLSISVNIRQELMAAIKEAQSKDIQMETPARLRTRLSRTRSGFTPKYSESMPGTRASMQRRIPLAPPKETDASYIASQISASRGAAESYRFNNVPSPEIWYGTWGSTVYEVRFTPGPGPEARVTTIARIIGHSGAWTQIKLAVDSNAANRYIFIDEKGECVHSFCPSLDADLVNSARQMFLVNENGQRVTMMRTTGN